jgi:hypothetical protein
MSTNSAIPPLFEMLPTDLFSPLASQNREQYWRLLCILYARFFGPESDIPPAIGWDKRDLVDLVVHVIENDDAWEPEVGENLATPTGIRAHDYLKRLLDSGWLLDEKVGGVTTVSMPTNVARFMDTLQSFSEFTPPAVGAKMRSIEGALSRVLDSAQPGDDLDEAANQAKLLVSSLGSMGLRVREVMRSLNANVSTADALKKIFGEYINKVYMADYSDLAGADHPLARKSAVLAMANEISMHDHRERLVRWYADHRKGGNIEAAEEHLDRTLRRIKSLSRLQDFIDRLEEDLRRMNRRMLALIDYRLHAPSHLEKRIERAVQGVRDAEVKVIDVPSGPGQLLSGGLLYKPRKKLAPIPSMAENRQQMTPAQEARMRLRVQALTARRVQSKDIYSYLDRVMGTNRSMLGSELPILSIKDFRVVQTLGSLALAAETMTKARRAGGVVGKLPKFSFSAVGGWLKNGYLGMADFRILRVG